MSHDETRKTQRGREAEREAAREGYMGERGEERERRGEERERRGEEDDDARNVPMAIVPETYGR